MQPEALLIVARIDRLKARSVEYDERIISHLKTILKLKCKLQNEQEGSLRSKQYLWELGDLEERVQRLEDRDNEIRRELERLKQELSVQLTETMPFYHDIQSPKPSHAAGQAASAHPG